MQLFENLHLIYRLNKSKNLKSLINEFRRQLLNLRKLKLTFHTEAWPLRTEEGEMVFCPAVFTQHFTAIMKSSYSL